LGVFLFGNSLIYTKPQKVLCKSKSVLFETQKRSRETKVPKVLSFGETMLYQDTVEWPFLAFLFVALYKTQGGRVDQTGAACHALACRVTLCVKSGPIL
jgi:hypothetical protein